MILTLHSDVSYLSEGNSCSRTAGHVYLSKKDNEEFNNGTILMLSTIIQHIVASECKTELAALFHNAEEAAQTRVTMEGMGYNQPATTI
eukprot:4363748-Ditylum_brightwellii.AAC.1